MFAWLGHDVSKVICKDEEVSAGLISFEHCFQRLIEFLSWGIGLNYELFNF